MALSVVAATKTTERENKVASGLVTLMNEPMIHSDLLFLATFSEHFLDVHMKWYGSKDDNIGELGFLIFHQFVRYFIMQQELKNLENGGWETHPDFELFQLKLQTLSLEDKNLKILMANQCLHCALKQVRKHNVRYARTRQLVHACFAEPSSSKYIACHILGHMIHYNQSAIREDTLQSFFSRSHQRIIDPCLLINFMLEETSSAIDVIRGSQLIVDFKDTLVIIANGGNI